MVGTWAAIKRWTQTVDHEDRKARIKEECLKMVAPFEGVPGVVAKISDSEYGHQPYGIMVHIDEAVTGVVSQSLLRTPLCCGVHLAPSHTSLWIDT
eukprot:COSAG02_NODE_2552_length_8553_cov_4.740123_5_plen_96_part_00